jgi:hypothetical protein
VPATSTAHPAPARHPAGDPSRDAPHDRLSAGIVAFSKWTGFITGLLLFMAVALIPPAADLDNLRLRRDRVLAMEQTDLARIANYRALLASLDERDPDTVNLVLAAQLQLVPRGSTALINPGGPQDPQLFELLEPLPAGMPRSVVPTVPSALTRLATSDRGRVVLLLIGALALLWGLMPEQARRQGV